MDSITVDAPADLLLRVAAAQKANAADRLARHGDRAHSSVKALYQAELDDAQALYNLVMEQMT